jgi:hexosaminidase
MMNFKIVVFLLISVLSAKAFGIVPQPDVMEKREGVFRFTAQTVWSVENATQHAICADFMQQFTVVSGFSMGIKEKKTPTASVIFRSNAALGVEAYMLEVTPRLLLIEASSEKGFFYALETLKQLLPPEYYGSVKVTAEWTVSCMRITDTPHMGYRGFMLDVSRYFMPKDHLLKMIDYLAMIKINYLHLHLVDDNGWRIEIKKYPRLTDIGAFRVNRENYFSMRENPISGEPTTEGGYYTQDDIREIIAYAGKKQIEVIPEIEMPAHTNSSLAAYPGLTCPHIQHDLNVLPGIGGHSSSVIYCAGNDEVFNFLQDVIDEVCELFPSRYFHLGGDEAWKENWKKCPLCQKRIQDNNLKNEEELQSYFLKRVNAYLKTKKRIMIGWDEVADSQIPEGAVIMGWRGLGNAALKAADQGHSIIMTPAHKLYLIRYQGPQWFEPFTYFGNNTLEDVYKYNPFETMTSEQAQMVMGVQGSLWTEFVRNNQDVEYLAFPRLTALAEIGWTKPENQNWERFLANLDELTARYDLLGLNYARSMFNIQHKVVGNNGILSAELSCIRPDLEIRYTLDGSEPKTMISTQYNNVITLKNGDFLKAATFRNGKREGRILPLRIVWHQAAAAKVWASFATANLLTNGLLGSEKYSDGEYADFFDENALFTIELKQEEAIRIIVVHTLNNYGMAVQLPRIIKISVSSNGREFRQVAKKEFAAGESFSKGFFKTGIEFEFSGEKAKFIKIEAEKPGICPAGHVREGQASRMVFDEIEVR